MKAVESKPWDPGVQSLVAFPQALAMMGEKPDWVQSVGDAFLAQPEDVMNSVQTLRAAAQKQGNLKTNEQQKVIVEQAPQSQQTIIKIEPASPQVMFVPAYNPTALFGAWPYPSYPPYYWPTPGYAFGSALMTGIAFGTGIAITNALWGGVNWGRGDVDINVNRYNNINVNKQLNANQNKWEHNAGNRKGVPYRDAQSHQKFDKPVAGADGRIVADSSDPAHLAVGASGWTLPIPIVKAGDRWRFDTRAGADEIRTRRIGRNELSAIQAALAYYDAQKAYALADRNGDGVLEYAQRIVSTPGKRDGLYWAALPGED